jgi:hypothetical protein
MRGAMRAGRALSRLGLFLSGHGERRCGLLAEIPDNAAQRGALLRVGSTRRRCDRTAPRSVGPLEYSTDRVGGTFRDFDVAADPDGKTCQAHCDADSHCRAWTYARPGYYGTSAHCYLKERITKPLRRPCCISGVVR